jgi:hypothetical protein
VISIPLALLLLWVGAIALHAVAAFDTGKPGARF